MDYISQNLIRILHLDTLSSAAQEKALLRIGKIIYERIIMRVVQTLSTDDIKEFEKMRKEKIEPEKIAAWLEQKIPNFEKIVGEEISKFKESAIGLVTSVESPS